MELLSGAACIGQGIATVLTQIACETLRLDPAQVVVRAPDTATTPDSGTTTASRQTLITGEACRRACAAVLTEARKARGLAGGAGLFSLAELAGREFLGEYEAVTDPFETGSTEPVRHIAYSFACQLVILGEDRRVQRIMAAHDSGLVVNPLSFEGQVEGGVVMGLGYALTESFPLEDCVPTARFGQLGLWRAPDVPPIQTITVRRTGPGSAADGGVSGAGYGAKGIGEISTIPTAAAVAGAYFARDGRLRTRLPLEDTPYRRSHGRVRRTRVGSQLHGGQKMSDLIHGGKTCLLVIDMQNAFIDPKGSLSRMGLDTSRTRTVIEPIRRLRRAFHDAGLPVIYLQHTHQPDGGDMGLIAKVFPPIRALGHCFDGSWDAGIIDELAPEPRDHVVKKHRFSGFYHTTLEELLRSLSVESLVVSGIATNICVESTVRDAFYRDYPVIVPKESTASFTPEQEAGSFGNFAFAFATVLPLEEVVCAL